MATIASSPTLQSTASSSLITKKITTEPTHVTANVGPLDPSFTPASDCTNLTLNGARIPTERGEEPILTLFWGAGGECAYQKRTIKSACLPSRYGTLYQAHTILYPVLSPGFACPTGHTPACTLVATTTSPVSSITSWNALGDGDTAIGCCPTGYTCGRGPLSFYECWSTATPGQVLTIDFAHANCFDRTATGPSLETLTLVSTAIAMGSAPQIVYMVARSTASNTAPNPVPGNNSTGDGDSSSTGLSTGAKAGIGASVGLVAIALLVLAVFFYRRKRSKVKEDTPLQTTEAAPDQYRKAELSPDSVRISELYGDRVVSSELDATSVAARLSHIHSLNEKTAFAGGHSRGPSNVSTTAADFSLSGGGGSPSSPKIIAELSGDPVTQNGSIPSQYTGNVQRKPVPGL